MRPTDTAVEKQAEQGRVDGPESVFSAHCLPVDFYTDIYHGFEAKGGIDLSVGQGTAAKAALQLRLPYFGFALTDQHCLQAFDRERPRQHGARVQHLLPT